MRTEIRILTVVLMTVCLVGLSGCGAHDADHGAGHAATHAEDGSDSHAAHADADADGSSHGLALDGSRKWQMDDHTRATFGKMVQRMQDTDLATADADVLMARGGELKQDLGDLIAGCTMTGAAHDELHKFLTLYMPAVDQLAKSGDSAQAVKLQGLLETYANFFE